MAVRAVPAAQAEENRRKKKRKRKSQPGCTQWGAAERILTLVVVDDGNEQVGLPGPFADRGGDL